MTFSHVLRSVVWNGTAPAAKTSRPFADFRAAMNDRIAP
jgi:hypothetical protein